jgi:putative ABC transport system permease protein
VNVANLALGRAVENQLEFATRAALGAGRARLLRQVLVENLFLAAIGGAAGVGLALTIVAWFRSQVLFGLPRLHEVTIDLRTLAFAIVATGLSGLLFAVIPAIRASGARPQSILGGANRGRGSRGSRRLGEVLAGGEVALSTALLVIASLLGHSLFEVLNKARGFETVGAATARISLPPAKYRAQEARIALRSIVDRVDEIQGVESAGVVSLLPLTQENDINPVVAAEAGPIPVLERPTANFRWASTGYFEAMGIRTLRGRVFREEESVARPVVISESVARTLWPGQDPVGREIRELDDKPPYLLVLGVVPDVPVESLETESTMVVYLPYWDRPRKSMALAVRTHRSLESLTPEVRRAIWAVDPDVPAVALEPVADLVAASTADRRFQVFLLLLFAGVALTLACLGVYGVLAQSIGRRTNEIGLRMALGAQASEVRRLVFREGMRPVLAGLVIGMIAALGFSRVLESMLFGVNPIDPLTLVVVPGVLLLAAWAACSVPARRAAAVDPMVALRYE